MRLSTFSLSKTSIHMTEIYKKQIYVNNNALSKFILTEAFLSCKEVLKKCVETFEIMHGVVKIH